MQDFYVYILRCRDGSYYTGHTDNIEERLDDHYTGKTKSYTSTRRPIELVYVSEFPSRYEALSAERQIKGWSRKKKEALIMEKFHLLEKFSKKIFKK